MTLRSRGSFLVVVLLLPSLTVHLGCGERRPESVVLIVVDALRADHLGTYGYARSTSPHLDQWAKQAAVFEQAFTTSPWTLPAFGSMLTGELPSRHAAGSRVRESNWTVTKRLNDSLPTLPEVLSRSGFVTGAIVNNPWLPPGIGLERGFQSYDYSRPSEEGHRRADEVVDLSLAWIDANADAPFFLMVHILDPHMSYDAPPPFRGRFTSDFEDRFALPVVGARRIRKRAKSISSDERAFITTAYDEEIAFVDQELGRFFETLQKRDLWNRLLIILTSDHGEELFDHGGFEHGHNVHQELLRVPFLIWGPSVRSERHTGPVSVVDLPDTILAAVGLDPLGSMAGHSLWPVLVGKEKIPCRSIIAEATLYGPERKAIIRWPLKLTLQEKTGYRRLYNLARDPQEQFDLAELESDAAEVLNEELNNALKAARSGVQAKEVPLDEEMLRELRSLGYVN